MFTHTKDHCNCSTYKVSFVFTSCLLVMDPNSVLCLSPYWLANIPQLDYCCNWLTPILATISHQPSTFLFTD
jgi:hypothetical protein